MQVFYRHIPGPQFDVGRTDKALLARQPLYFGARHLDLVIHTKSQLGFFLGVQQRQEALANEDAIAVKIDGTPQLRPLPLHVESRREISCGINPRHGDRLQCHLLVGRGNAHFFGLTRVVNAHPRGNHVIGLKPNHLNGCLFLLGDGGLQAQGAQHRFWFCCILCEIILAD